MEVTVHIADPPLGHSLGQQFTVACEKISTESSELVHPITLHRRHKPLQVDEILVPILLDNLEMIRWAEIVGDLGARMEFRDELCQFFDHFGSDLFGFQEKFQKTFLRQTPHDQSVFGGLRRTVEFPTRSVEANRHYSQVNRRGKTPIELEFLLD